MSADFSAALAMPPTFGTKLFEITVLLAVAAACKVNVKDAGDLLLLRDWIFKELGPRNKHIHPSCGLSCSLLLNGNTLPMNKRTCII
jgi:hypothetical protein